MLIALQYFASSSLETPSTHPSIHPCIERTPSSSQKGIDAASHDTWELNIPTREPLSIRIAIAKANCNEERPPSEYHLTRTDPRRRPCWSAGWSPDRCPPPSDRGSGRNPRRSGAPSGRGRRRRSRAAGRCRFCVREAQALALVSLFYKVGSLDSERQVAVCSVLTSGSRP